MSADLADWQGTDSDIANLVRLCSERALAAYRVHPNLVTEHANIERAVAQGGYGRRQLYELVQNGADALRDSGEEGTIKILLTPEALYCANEGNPVDPAGVIALLNSHVSAKRGLEIGRFGLGFKSVLEITDSPQIFSRSGSFGFDRGTAARHIRSIVPQADRTPCLRIADPIEPSVYAQADQELAKLMDWATTVIRLPRHPNRGKWLSDDIRSFPAEFLLFSSHVRRVVLEDRTNFVHREFRLQAQGNLVLLEESGRDPQAWKVYQMVYQPTPEARREAGELADRSDLPFVWAVPLEGRSERGEFWAFFPTKYRTTLSGVLNAPWKTNEDRQNLLESRFNEELIGAAAQLIGSSLPDLASSFDDDAGRYLTLLPARGREAPNWADEALTSRVYEEATQVPSLPDQDRVLRPPHQLRMPPDTIPDTAHEIWNVCTWRPKDWVHSDTLRSADRRSRVRRLIQDGNGNQASMREWLEAIITDDGRWAIQASAAAIRAAAEIARTQTQLERQSVAEAAIVLTADGNWVPPARGMVFIANGAEESAVVTVHAEVVRVDGVPEALEYLGVGHVDASSELRHFLSGVTTSDVARRDLWRRFWELARRVPFDTSEAAIREWSGSKPAQRVVHVRTRAGSFVPLDQALLPGGVVPGDGSRDLGVAIDVDFHVDEMPLLRGLGAVTGPETGRATADEPWFAAYRRSALQAYGQQLEDLSLGTRPQPSYLAFDERPATGPLSVLVSSDVSGEGKSRFVEAMFPSALDDESWVLHHETQERYPRMSFDPPSIWVARQYGYLRTSLGPYPVRDCVGSELRDWSSFMPVAECGAEVQRKLALPRDWSELREPIWSAALARAQRIDSVDERQLGAFYAVVCEHQEAPRRIRCRVGSKLETRPTNEVVAAAGSRIIGVCIEQAIPFIALATEQDANSLIDSWGLQDPRQTITVKLHASPSGPSVPIADVFLGLYLRMSVDVEMLQLVPCSSLWEETVTPAGRSTDDRKLVVQDECIYYVDHLSEAQLLDALIDHYGVMISEGEKSAILENRTVEARRARLADIRARGTMAERLLAAVGAGPLRDQLPQSVQSAATSRLGRLSDVQVAELTLGVYGIETLFNCREALQVAGLQPPVQWAGSYQAKQFVKELGFPPEFGGFEGGSREPSLDVDGPITLPPLHDFQEAALNRIRDLILSSTNGSGGRGLLSLPTGAGKTRIAVEAVVRLLRDGGMKSPVLWIAQSDELCEQAVQAWRAVWRSCGPTERLRISRFWAANDADYHEGGHQVVVATMQKLNARLERPEYEWLSKASFVIIDEAHLAVSQSYTRILHWLGLVRRETPRPVLGLTATPFRGGEGETDRLAARFSRNRLDEGILGDDTYSTLQNMGVLAEVDHEVLAGSELELNDSELAQVETMGLSWLPRSAEQRLGNDAGRTGMLLDSLLRLPDHWPILVFATSVDNAHTLAALLNTNGVRAASIYADMRAGARRHYVEEFRRGSVRVLTNYGVLTTGFDAPAVRAIFVARPTFSPVLYQQMVGRGLRGPRNGGKERCLIINIEDTFRQFGDQLAFREFDFLWKSQ